MLDEPHAKSRLFLLLLPVVAVAWIWSPGLPVLWEPSADQVDVAVGRMLFNHRWRPNDVLAGGDGVGPVFNANSCVECHFQGGVGGGGSNEHNVLAFMVHPAPERLDVQFGLVHHKAVDVSFQESKELVGSFFPSIPGGLRIDNGCGVKFRDFNPVRFQPINTTALFGAGWIDRISDKTIRHNRNHRAVSTIVGEVVGDFEEVVHGRLRILEDGRVGRFGWKAQFATLEEFVAAACANELGLGNPLMDQATPVSKQDYQPNERDLNQQQFAALVSFVDTLPRPVQILPDAPSEHQKILLGEKLFHEIRCASCHTPSLGGVDGIYSDLMLHRIENRKRNGGSYVDIDPVTPLPGHVPDPEEWRTPPLWGVADSAPYFHDGRSQTLKAAIIRHGGDARHVAKAFKDLSSSGQNAIIAFLKSLKAPQDALPVRDRE